MKKIGIMFLVAMFFGLVSGATNIAYSFNSDTISGTTVSGEDSYFEYKEKLSLQKETCETIKGCWKSDECFPYGYHNNNSYCGQKMKYYNKKWNYEGIAFLEQKDDFEDCSDDFECKSNFCFNEECINKIKIVNDEVVRINKSDLEKLREIIESAEESMEEDYNKEVSQNFFSSLFGLLRNVFGL